MGERKSLESRNQWAFDMIWLFFFFNILDDEYIHIFCDTADDTFLNNVTSMAESHISIF